MRVLSKIILLVVFIVASSKTAFADNEYTLESINENNLSHISTDWHDLDLTDDELEAVAFAQNNNLSFGLYQIDGYNFQFENHTLGTNYYMMLQLQEYFDITFDVLQGDFNTIMDLYFQEEIDIVPGLLITEDREDFFYFTNIKTKPDIFLFSEEYITLTTISDLDGKVIAKEEGMKIISEEYIRFLAEYDINITLVDYGNIDDAILDLGNSIDYIIHSKNSELIKSGLEFMDAGNILNSYDLHLTTLKTSTLKHLGTAFEKAYKMELTKNLSEYRKEMEYLLFEEGFYFTEEEISFIHQTQVNPIKVNSASKWIPYLYTNNQGDLEGYAYDMFQTLSNNLGIEYDFSYDSEYTWDSMLNDLGNNGNTVLYDMGIADSVTKYDYDFAVYSYPIRTEEAYVVGLHSTKPINDLFELQNYKVGIIPYYAATTYLKTNLVFKEFVVYNNLEEMITGLNSGEIDYFAVIKSEYDGLYYIQKNYNIAPKYSIRNDFNVAMIFPKTGENTPVLRSLYNKALVLSNKDNLSEDYFNMQTDLNEVVQKRTMQLILIGIGIVIVLVTFISLIYVHKLRKNLYFDVLTKAKNRRSLFSKGIIKTYYYLYYIDFDNFKEINDKYGHMIGDDVLIFFTQRIKQNFEGILYRIGGDEFVLLSNTLYDNTAFTSSVYRYDNTDIPLTFSIGSVVVSDYLDIPEDLIIRYADIAMYKAKDNGKNQLLMFEEKMLDDTELAGSVKNIRSNQRIQED